MIKLAYTILYVQDVSKAVEFYEKAFGFTRKFVTPEKDYGEITGETTLSFAAVNLAKTNLSAGFTASNLKNKPFGIEIGFTTDKIFITLQNAIDSGATLVEDVKVKPWGQSVAYLRDLDGFLIELCTPIE